METKDIFDDEYPSESHCSRTSLNLISVKGIGNENFYCMFYVKDHNKISRLAAYFHTLSLLVAKLFPRMCLI